MSTKAARTSLFSHQPRSIPGWLTTNRVKRGALLYWASLFTLSAAIMHFIGVLAQPPGNGLLVVLLFVFAMIQTVSTVAVVAVPARRLLIAAAMVEGLAVLLWFVARTTGFPVGSTTWRPETLGIPDLYLPVMEAVSAFFFLCLAARTWTIDSRVGRIVIAALPYLLLVGILLWMAVNFVVAELVVVIFLLSADLSDSLLYIFLPAFALIALFLLLRLVFPRARMLTPRAWRTALALLPALLVVSILILEGGGTAASRAWFPASLIVRAPAGQTTTLEYCRIAGSPLAMDLSEPPARAPRPAPVVFFMHGGDGILGARQLGSADEVYRMPLEELLNHGFVVGSIDYGLAPLYTITNQVEEAKCAVRFLRAHASRLGIDPQRIGVYGFSEGGYLAAMLGTAGPSAGYDVGPYLNQSSRVQAVVDTSGLTDFTNLSGSPSWFQPLGKSLTGGHTSLAARRAISPVTYVAPGDPPFLIINGTDDWQVPPHHAQELAQRLHAAGVPETLVLVQHDGHGLDAPTPGQIEQPDPALLVQMILNFFVKVLGT